MGPTKYMKVGIVGLGKMGLLHAGILNTIPDTKIISVTEKERLIRKYFEKAIPGITTYDNYEKMILNEDLDLAYITSPSFTHLPIMISCIENDVSFFVEKPLTRNLDEVKALWSQLKNSKITHSVGYNGRFIDTFSKAKLFIDSKILGEVEKVNSSMFVSNIFSKPSGWRYQKKLSGGGVLLEFGCHLVDILLWYFGQIERVKGKTKSVYSEVEDFAKMEMEFKNGIFSEMETSWSVDGYRIPEITIEIAGTNGTMKVNQDFIDITLKNSVPEIQGTKTRIYKQSLATNVPFDVGSPEFTKEDMHVIECVKQNRRPLVDAIEASKTQSVIQAMYDSVPQNNWQEVAYVS